MRFLAWVVDNLADHVELVDFHDFNRKRLAEQSIILIHEDLLVALVVRNIMLAVGCRLRAQYLVLLADLQGEGITI